MRTPSLPGHWKLLIVSLLIMQAVTLWLLFDLSDYAVWLHFDGRETRLMDTAPGKKAAVVVGVVAGLLFVINAIKFGRAVEPASPEEIAALREGRIPTKDEREG